MLEKGSSWLGAEAMAIVRCNLAIRLTYISVNLSETIYVAEFGNDRVTRWSEGFKEGMVIVGGNGRGSKANQFYNPERFLFDRHNNLSVTDTLNHRMQRTRVTNILHDDVLLMC